MKTINFSKIVAAGNDFVVIDNRREVLSKNLAQYARTLLDRKKSVGSDGLLLIGKSTRADIRMRIFNPDGSEAAMCGNGVRCAAKFAVEQKMAGPRLSIETLAGLIPAEVKGDQVKVKMPDPKHFRLNLSVEVDGAKYTLHFVDTGVPHAVIPAAALESCSVEGLGRKIRNHSDFSPKGANVDFILISSKNHVQVRTYERGVEAETLSCGTGSTASALVAAALEDWKAPVFVHTRGGEILKISFVKKGEDFKEVTLEGSVQTPFEGRVKL